MVLIERAFRFHVEGHLDDDQREETSPALPQAKPGKREGKGWSTFLKGSFAFGAIAVTALIVIVARSRKKR